MAIYSNDVSDKVLRVLQSANRLDYNKLTAARAAGTGASVDVLERMLRSGDDVVLLATGASVHRALEAAETLAEDGIDAAVVDFYRLAPVPGEELDTLLQP